MKIRVGKLNKFGRYDYTAKLTLAHWAHIIKGSVDLDDGRVFVKSVSLALDHSPRRFAEVVGLVEQSSNEILEAVKKAKAPNHP